MEMVSNCAVVNWIPEMSLPCHGPSTALLNSQDPNDTCSDNANDFIMTKKLIEEDKVEILREEWKFASRVLNKFFMWIIITAIISNAVYVILKAPSGNLL